MTFECWGKQDDISVGESVTEMQFIVASKDEIKIETFDCGVAEGSDEAGVGGMIDFSAKLFIFLNDLSSDNCDVAHL